MKKWIAACPRCKTEESGVGEPPLFCPTCNRKWPVKLGKPEIEEPPSRVVAVRESQPMHGPVPTKPTWVQVAAEARHLPVGRSKFITGKHGHPEPHKPPVVVPDPPTPPKPVDPPKPPPRGR